MKGKQPKKNVIDLFRSRLDAILDTQHELCKLSREVAWDWIDEQLSGYYSDRGRPSVPVRTIVGLLLLKHLFNESDEGVLARWVENPYWQYFTGETHFCHEAPFDPTDFVKFRQRIGEQGMEKVLALSVKLHPGSEHSDEIQTDTTVQEKDITFPTDDKLAYKIIGYCWKYTAWEDIRLRQSYKREVKKLRLQMHNGHHPKRRKQAGKARKRLKTIAGYLIRDLQRKMTPEALEHYGSSLEMFTQVLHQTRNDKDKRYSLHEPAVWCIAKGKAHKKYEFGCKVSVTRTAKSGVILGMKSFEGNPYDGNTLDEAFEQVDRICSVLAGTLPKRCTVDRGYRGRKQVQGILVDIPKKPTQKQSAYHKSKERKRFRKRAAIEPVIAHLKQDHRMGRNFLDGVVGDAVNCLLAGAAFNFKKRLNRIKANFLALFLVLLHQIRADQAGQRKIGTRILC